MSAFDQYISFFYTRDLEKTARFYEDVMGLTLWRDQGDCRIYQLHEGAYLGFCAREDAPEQPVGIIICLVTDDVDEWYERLRSQGVVFEKTPSHNPKYHIYHCFLRDPNGYLLEIQRFLE
ncbi:MAG: VOC family protein [Chloroflexi bacterium]|nr:VOC family protein [Chloroflexota bacterium]